MQMTVHSMQPKRLLQSVWSKLYNLELQSRF